MSFNENNFDDLGEAELPEESNNNRTFTIAIAILGGIILISVACLGVFLLLRSRGTSAAQQAQATTNANGTASAIAVINQALTSTFQASILPTDTSTPFPTSTPPVGVASLTSTPDLANLPPAAPATSAAATATVGAALTQAAAAQLTVVSTTTALPKTGIADEYGLPGLVVMALAFVIVILLARRLRATSTTNR